MRNEQCGKCGKKLKVVTRYHHGYQGKDWTDEGVEAHDSPDACIRHLAAEIQKLKDK
jgi:hypothetical protein